MKFINSVLVIAAAVVAVLCARSGLSILALVFGGLAVISTFLPLNFRYKMIMVAAFGLPLLLFVEFPIAGGAITFLMILAILTTGRIKVTVKMLVLCLVSAILAGVIMGIGNIILGVALILVMFVIVLYCIFLWIHRMNKFYRIKVD